MPDYGLLPTGFSRMRLPEIQAAIIADLKLRTGLDFDTDPASVTGQFIAIYAEREAAQWELTEAVYAAMYPPSAIGQALDDAVAFVGIRRIPASRTEVEAILYGAIGTLVPADTTVRSSIPSGNYLLQDSVTIATAAVVEIVLKFTVVNSFSYAVTINGVGYNYNSDATANGGEIAAGIAAVIPAGITATVFDTNRVRLVSATAFNIVLGTNVLVDNDYSVGSPGIFYRQEVGPFGPPAGTLTQIVTSVSGLTSVTNPVEASFGRYEETDIELRNRYKLGVFRTGAGSINAIEANLLNDIKNVTYAKVYQNKTNATDADGRPAHSVEAVVVGGLNQAIFDMLLNQVVAGIETHGNVTGTSLDSEGTSWVMKFSRPVDVKSWLKITVTKYTEEPFPDDAGSRIADAAVLTGASFGVGKDIILQRFFGPIYSAVSGIGNVAITVATGETVGPGDYSSANKVIGLRELSVWDASRISVTVL